MAGVGCLSFRVGKELMSMLMSATLWGQLWLKVQRKRLKSGSFACCRSLCQVRVYMPAKSVEALSRHLELLKNAWGSGNVDDRTGNKL